MKQRIDDFGAGCFGLILIGVVLIPCLGFLLAWAL